MSEDTVSQNPEHQAKIEAAMQRAKIFKVGGMSPEDSREVRRRIELALQPFPGLQREFLIKLANHVKNEGDEVDFEDLRALLELMNVHHDVILNVGEFSDQFTADHIGQLQEKIYDRHGDEPEVTMNLEKWLTQQK